MKVAGCIQAPPEQLIKVAKAFAIVAARLLKPQEIQGRNRKRLDNHY